MSFQWADYLAVARHLESHSTTSDYQEGCLRAAVSRAYYAALNTARNFLRDQWGIEVPGEMIHKDVPRWFMDAAEMGYIDIDDDEIGYEIGVLLDRLRGRRRQADYDDKVSGLSSLADISLEDAQLVVERISTL
ncbi:MAG: DNA-binding protein [Candidatus Bipolaricaulia bacterium]